MVVLLQEAVFVDLAQAEAPPTTCLAVPAPSGRRVSALPCWLESGHAGHHQTQVRVRRENGTTAGYTYSWLA